MESRGDLRDKRGESSVPAEETGDGGNARNHAELEAVRICILPQNLWKYNSDSLILGPLIMISDFWPPEL